MVDVGSLRSLMAYPGLQGNLMQLMKPYLMHPTATSLLEELGTLAQQRTTQNQRKALNALLAKVEAQFPNELEEFLTENPTLKKRLNQSKKQQKEYLTVFNPNHYQDLRQAIATNGFNHTQGSPWPTAKLGKQGQAQLIPAIIDPKNPYGPEEIQDWPELMWQQREQLSDLTVDVLDTLSAIWLQKSKHAKDDAVAGLDSLLSLRGLRPKTDRNQEPRGYSTQQRTDIFRSLTQIQNLWLTISKADITEITPSGRKRKKTKVIQSRAFVITDRMGQLRLDGLIDVESFVFRPGKVFAEFLFGPGRQTALLSARALTYDPYRHAWEKRLTRYLSWHWKSNRRFSSSHSHTYSVDKLLNIVDDQATKTKRQRDRLETALNRLKEDSIIQDWSYASDNPVESIVVYPPSDVVLPTSIPSICVAETADTTTESLATRVRNQRRAQRLNQKQLSSHFVISQPYLSMIEKGKIAEDQMSPELLDRIYKWLSNPFIIEQQ